MVRIEQDNAWVEDSLGGRKPRRSRFPRRERSAYPILYNYPGRYTLWDCRCLAFHRFTKCFSTEYDERTWLYCCRARVFWRLASRRGVGWRVIVQYDQFSSV